MMRSWRLSPQLLLLLLAVVVARCAAAHPPLTTPVDHAIHFDRRTGATSKASTSFGSQASLLRGSILLFDPAATTSYKRRSVFIPSEVHITQAQWEQLAALPVRGVVAATSPFDTRNEELLQHYLSHTAVPFPVYFLPQDGEAARKLRDTIVAMSPSEYAVVSIGANEKAVAPVANTSVRALHIYASLAVRPKEVKAKAEMPRLLITAAFDTLGVAPTALTTGGASSTVAALELWRRFNAEAALAVENSAADAAALSSPYGVSLLLGSTGRFNYVGTSRWISTQPEGELDSYLLVICLDELLLSGASSHDDDDDDDDDVEKKNTGGSASRAVRLFMHVHDSFAKSPQYAKVKETAETLAAQRGIELTVLSAKTNYNHYDIRFEHEVLAHRQIPAVTFSTVRKYRVDQLFRGRRAPIATAAGGNANITTTTAAALTPFSRRVDFVHAFAQALLSRPAAAGAQPWVGSAAYMAGLLRHAAESQRSPVAGGGAGLLKYAETLEAHMKQRAATPASRRALSTNVALTSYRLSQPGVVLVGPYEQVMNVFVAKSAVVELLLLVVVLAVVGAFSFMEFGCKKTLCILLDNMDEEDTAKTSSSTG